MKAECGGEATQSDEKGKPREKTQSRVELVQNSVTGRETDGG